MLKRTINNNIKKISIIGIALAFIIGLILLVTYLIPIQGIVSSKLSDTIASYAVNVKDSDIGKLIWRDYYSDLCNNPNVYCIKKGKRFPGNVQYKASAKYSLNGAKINRKDESGDASVEGEADYKYHVAILYVMSQQDKNNKYEYNDCQYAMWAIMSYFGNRSDTTKGYVTNVTINSLKGNAKKIAQKALGYADYMWQQANTSKKAGVVAKSTTDTEKVNYIEKTIDEVDYIIAGPYSVEFPSVKKTDNEGKTIYSFGTIAAYKDEDGNKINEGIQVCDKDGKFQESGAAYITANKSKFYLRVKKSDLTTQGKTFSIPYTKTTLTGRYYWLKSTYSANQDLVEGEASLKQEKQTIQLKIQPGTQEEYIDTTFNVNIIKKDENFNNKLENAIFSYSLNNNNWVSDTCVAGELSIPNITINKEIYNSLPAREEDGKKVYTILIEEQEAPDQYEKITGNIQVELLLRTIDTEEYQGSTKVITHKIEIENYLITNNASNQIKANNTSVDSGETKLLNKTNNATIELEVPNTKIEYPDYEIKLDKFDTNNQKLNAEFIVEVGPLDATSDKEKEKIQIFTSKDLMVGEVLYDNYMLGDANRDGIISADDYKQIQKYRAHMISENEIDLRLADTDLDGEVNILDVRPILRYIEATNKGFYECEIIKTHEDGSFTINLNDIEYTGTIKVTIREYGAPREYGIIEKDIELYITIDRDRKITEVTTNIDSLAPDVSIIGQEANRSINIKAIDKKELLGEDEIVIEKVDENNVGLPGVTFSIYDGDNETKILDKLITSDERGKIGRTKEFKVNYQAENYQLGDIVDINKYIIKETNARTGYKGLSDDEKILVDMYGKAISTTNSENANKIVSAYSVIKNETNQEIYIKNNNNNVITINANESAILYDSRYVNNINQIMAELNINNAYDKVALNISGLILKIENKKIEDNNYEFDILKINSTSNLPLSGAEFAIYDKEGFAPGLEGRNAIQVVTTEEDGKAKFTIPLVNTGIISYYIQEIKAPEGHILYDSDKYIRLDLNVQFDSNTNRNEVQNITVYNRLNNNAYTGNKSIWVNSHIIEAYYLDENNESWYNADDETISTYTVSGEELNSLILKLPNDARPEEGRFKINVEKINSENNNKIKDAKFLLKDEKLGEWNLITNESGISTTGDITITESNWSAGIHKYILEEIEAPAGYEKINGQINILVNYGKDNNIYNVQSIEITNRTNGKVIVNGDEISVDETKEYIISDSTITITIPNEPKIDLALKKFIKGVKEDVNSSSYIIDTTEQREPRYDKTSLTTTTQAKYRFGNAQTEKTSLQPVEVSNGNIVHYVIRVYNEGQSDGYASEIKDYLPNGVELAENSTINQTYGWIKGDNNSISTRYLEDKIISKYNGGVTINSRDVEVELKVTEPDMYIGTLKNVAEISEMKDESNNTIGQDIDSIVGNTIITRKGETIEDKYSPTTIDGAGKYYDDISYGEDDVDFEYIKLKDPVIAGRIWIDVPPENSKDDNNNVIDNHEILSGIETYKTLKENGGLVAKLYKNSTYWKDIDINDDGTYEISVPKSDDGVNYNSYEIRFEYNGIDYTNVIENYGNDNTINSKAEEAIAERTAFNNKFGTINAQSDITYSFNSEKTTSKYNITDNMKIASTTETITLTKDTKANDLKYYNLGLKRRPTFDLALIKDVTSARVTVNGQTEEYKYDKLASFNPETQSFDEFIVKLRNGDFNSSLGIRDTDREALNSVVATYSLRIVNQSSIFGEATKVKDYFDNTIYDVSKVYIKDNNQEINIPYTVENGVIVITVPAHVIGNNESYYVYIDLTVKSEKIAELKDINKKFEPLNYAEICEYKTYTDKTKTSTPGIIDINSAPDNYSNGFNENDTGRAPVIYIGDRDESVRTLSGNVFEDVESRPNITGVKVELIEITADGSYVVRDEVETANGNYTFAGFLPGNYIVRFNYGNDKKTVLTTENGGANEHSYNGQDYTNTDYNVGNYIDAYWYLTVTDKSDAIDNKDRRNNVNTYSKVLTNYIAEVLNSWKSNPIDEIKVQELIQKTNMYGDTAQMTLSVEYGGPVVSSVEIKPYNVSGIDFGLKKRPTSEIELTKNVSKLTLKSSSGETLVEAAPQRDGNSVQWMVNSFVKIEEEDSVLNGANLEIEYTLTVKGVGEIPTKAGMIVDYIDNNLRFEESINEGWQVIQASELQNTEDSTHSLVNNNIDLSNRQIIVVTTDSNPLESKLANGQTATSKIVLTKTLTTSNSVDDDLSYNNVAEILVTENDEGRKTESSIPGNLNPSELPEILEPADASAELVSITNPTGQIRVYYVLGITIAVILAAGIISIKKFVLDKRN